MLDSVGISGRCDAQFAGVEQAFADGFVNGREVGGALSVWHDGQCVVDLWAGHADRKKTKPWQADTLCCFFSISKAVSTTCLLQAVDEGLVDLDAQVADYWPEFSANGKAGITVRHILSHQAGLPGLHEPVEREMLYDWHGMCERLAAETPWWTPGTKHGYHARTFGFLVGEILRRASGDDIGTWLSQKIARPLNLDVYFGLSEVDQARCAEMIPGRMSAAGQRDMPAAVRRMMKDFTDTSTPTGAAFQNPSMGPGYMNTAQFRAAQIPALNGHGTARGVAALLENIPRLLSPQLLSQALETMSLGKDEVLKSISHFGLGYMLYAQEAPIGWQGCFGHAGAGGSVAFCDPQRNIGFAFVMNQMQQGVVTGGATATACSEALELALT